MNDKQGGYWWTGCANVTINPDPKDPPCPNAAPNWTPPDAKIINYFASREEHEARVAALIEWEKSPEKYSDYPDMKSALSEISRNLGAIEDESPVDVHKRDASTQCYGRCFGIERDLAVEAVDWFCQKYEGFEIDTRPGYAFFSPNGPPSRSDN